MAGAEGVEELVEEVELGHAEGDPVLLAASHRDEEGVEAVYLDKVARMLIPVSMGLLEVGL